MKRILPQDLNVARLWDEPAPSPEERFADQVAYDDRKKRGQFFTPPDIADGMVWWACARGPGTFLDPAVGPGIFLDRLMSRPPPSPRRVLACDVDSRVLAFARNRLDPSWRRMVCFRQVDFLAAEGAERFDAIVANPPYVRHHDAKLPEALFCAMEREHGVRLSRLTNIYGLFLLKIMSLLSPRGRAIVLTPAEFLNADFGRAIKQALLASPALQGFVVFDYTSSIFDGLMTTATLTLFDAARPSDAVRFARLGESRALSRCLRVFDNDPTAAKAKPQATERDGAAAFEVVDIPKSQLDPSRKWATSRTVTHESVVAPAPRGAERFGESGSSNGRHGAASVPAAPDLRPLSDFARCMRGIATGANDFFTLTREEVRQWKLPIGILRPCITKSAHAPGSEFTTADYRALVRRGRKAYVLSVTPETADRADAYLRHGESLGVHRRYLTRHRHPWYLTERREPAELWVTVFGRKRLRFVRNAAGILSLTTFHAIYLDEPYRDCAGLLMDYFQTEEFAERCAVEHRVYGDGLLKFEPRDVGRLLIPDLEAVLRRRGVRGRKMLF